MYKCPHRAEGSKIETFDAYMSVFDWHHVNCHCGIMDLYHFQKLEQDDHVRAYWESEGRLTVSWDTVYGRMLQYPKWKEFGNDIHNIGYPY